MMSDESDPKDSKPKKVRDYRRRHIRWDPDPSVVAMIDPDITRAKFEPKVAALVMDEAFGGCGLVTIANAGDFQVGAKVRVKVGVLDPMLSEIRWRRELDAKVIMLGVSYLE